jgi:hypothetical protein
MNPAFRYPTAVSHPPSYGESFNHPLAVSKCDGCLHDFFASTVIVIEWDMGALLAFCQQCRCFNEQTYRELTSKTVPQLGTYAGANNISLKGYRLNKKCIFNHIRMVKLQRYTGIVCEDMAFDRAQCVTQLCQVNLLRELVTKRYDKVAIYRHFTDIYTGGKYSSYPGDRGDREVDHIFESQVMAHGAATALQNRAFEPGICDELRKVLNPKDLSNYNNVAKSYNVSKGSMFKNYLASQTSYYKGSGLRASALMEQNERFMTNVTTAVQEVYPSIIEHVRELKRDDNYISGEFVKISEALDELFKGMLLGDDDYNKRRMRSGKYY